MTTLDLPPAGAAPRTVTTTVLLACGVIAGPLFTLAWAVEGATRAHYNPLRHPVSSLELGEFGWTQRVNFIVAGLLALRLPSGCGGPCGPWAARPGGRCWSQAMGSGWLARACLSPTR
jgi:Protein of unknown function (DUF998)